MKMIAASAVLMSVLLAISAMASIGRAQAADLEIIAGGGITGPLKELAQQFERTTGHKLTIRFATTPELIKMATTTAFDLAVVPREVFRDPDAKGAFAPSPMAEIAHVGLGVAVRAGAAKPDIATAEALKQALLKAQSVSTVPASAAGAQVLRLFERLGIAEAMKDKIKAQPGPAQMVQALAQGEAELGVFLINVLTTPGLDVVGPVPANLDQQIFYVGAVAKSSKQATVAEAFIAFLQMPASKAVIRSKGMTVD